jgi:myo-inositol 2-dehydrogenase/D-chiro-inositol 1-dehydrogenase
LAKVECLLPQNIVTHGHRDTWAVDQDDIHVADDILKAGYHSGATYYQNRAFLDAVKGDAPVIVSAQDGHLAVAMGVGAQISAAENRCVDMKELGL